MRMHRLGIAGTAKNTGKTTTLNAILECLRTQQPERRVALTSIGYDGEAFDTVTGMPKPRITVWPGVIVATASRCVQTGGAGLRVLQDTGIQTPLGAIWICEVEQAGRLVLAGPNKRMELSAALQAMEGYGVALAIVDGALNRITPMALADGLILATGAARTADIPRLVRETEGVLALLGLQALAPVGRTLQVGSILHRDALHALVEGAQGWDTAWIEGVIAEQMLFALPEYAARLQNKRLLLSDPTKLLLTVDAFALRRSVQTLCSRGVVLGVRRALPAVAVTVNPYYPLYRYSKKEYSAAYVDGRALLAEIRNAAGGIPCYDVLDGGASALFSDILAWMAMMAV